MIKKILLLAFFSSLFAQEYSVIIKDEFDNSFSAITQDHSGSLSAVGFKNHFSTKTTTSNKSFKNAYDYLSSLNSASGLQMNLTRVDELSGAIEESFDENIDNFNQAVSVVKTADNGYFVGGYTEDGTLMLLRMDSGLHVRYTKRFGTRNFDRMNRLLALRDGGVLSIGSSMTTRDRNDGKFIQGIGLNDIYLTRFSKQGKILWSKKFGTTYDDRGIDAAEAYDGTLLILGTTLNEYNSEITLMRIAENGDKIWLKRYKKKGVSYNAFKIITLKDSNFLVSITKRDPQQQEQIKLVKFDIQKNILGDVDIPTEYSSALLDIKERVDSTIVGVGYTDDTMKGNRDALALKVSGRLELIWKYKYGNSTSESLNSVVMMRDGDIAAAGRITQKNTQITNMWIVKIHSDGSYAQLIKPKNSKNIAASMQSIYDDLIKTYATEIKDKKLKVMKNLSIIFTSPALLFDRAKYSLKPQQKRFLTTFNMKLIPLLKRHKSEITSLNVNGHTSSEWGSADFSSGYLKNMRLSQKRSYSVLSYIFKDSSKKNREFLTSLFSSNAHSYAQTIMNPDEDRKLSRRVEFRIRV
ncbi:MAG: OmpA family protein, partial [Campylobacterota bacterium]|nr:OmpA family protein [Campylobacterota bacterium]